MKKLCENLKIKLGMFNFDSDSDRMIAYSLNKMLEEYALELDEQFFSTGDGDFLIKECLMGKIEETIIAEETL